MSRIDLNIVATGNFAAVESQLARLRAQIASLNSMGVGGISPAAAKSVSTYTSRFGDALAATGMFQKNMVNLTSETEKFGRSLQRGNLRLGQYFKAGSEHIRKQQGQIRSLAKEQVRLANSTAMSMGGGKAMVMTPTGIDQAIDKQRVLNEQHRIFRQVVQGGSTQLVNWGKNTQWAGRQLTVGLTMPLVIFGAVAGKMFMDADKQLTRLAKVYGDATKGAINTTELDQIRTKTLALATEISNTMGIATTETLGIAADIAATGKTNEDLLSSTREAMRLSVLGEVDRQEAMKATLAIQSVFKQDSTELTESINLLNAVENQTSTTLDDLVVGIIKAGPVVQGLGGSIGDLASMMVAMREGGIPAAEAANAIKSSLGGLINPTKQTTELLKGFGINLVDIVDTNAGDVIGTLTELQGALSGLDELSRQRAIEQMFGKFQFSRINALLNNLNKAGSQTEQVLKIAGMSTTQLAQTAATELKLLTESASTRFKRAIEGIKASMIPIGEAFVEFGTILIGFAKAVVDAFNGLPDPVKTVLKALGFLTMIAGPLIMITGVFGNFLGYLVKGVGALMAIRKGARGIWEHFTVESIAAKNATTLLETGIYNQTEATNILRAATEALNLELAQMISQLKGAATASQGASMGATTLANAERSAMAAGMGYGSVASYLQPGGKNVNKRSLTSFGGAEFSHLVPYSTLPAAIGKVQTVGTLVQGAGTAAQYQKAMGKTFAPQSFYDPSQGTRQQVLQGLAASQNRPTARTHAANLTAAESARLLPSRAEYDAYAAKYHASLRTLTSMGKDKLQELSSVMAKHIGANDIAGAERALLGAISNNQAAFDKYYLSELSKMQGITGNLQTVVGTTARRSLGLEEAIKAKAPGSGYTSNASGNSLLRLVSASAGGGAAAPTQTPLTASEQKYANALNKAEIATTNNSKWQEKLSYVTQKSEMAQTRLTVAQQGLADVHHKTKSIYDKYTRIVEEDGTVIWQNIATGKKLSASKDKVGGNLERLFLLYQDHGTAVQELSFWDRKLLNLKQREAAVGDRATAAKEQLSQAERELIKETKQLRSAYIKQILSASTFIGTEKITNALRTKVGAALALLPPAILEETQKINLVNTKQGQVAVLLDSNAQMLTAMNIATKQLITKEELMALGLSETDITVSKERMTRERLIAELNQQAAAHNLTEAQIRKLTNYINGLSQETIDTITTLNLVQQGAKKLALSLERAAGSPMLGPAVGPGRGAGLAKGAMGASMAAGMGMMFLPHDGGAGSKIAGGALMGASMGGMIGMMGGGPMAAIAGLAGGTAVGAAIPAIMEFNKASNTAKDALMRYSEAINGSSIMIDKFAKEFGVLKPSEQLTAAIGQISSPEAVVAEGTQILQTETGQQLLNLAKQFSGTELVDALSAQLKQLTLLEIFTPEQAKAVAQTLAIELGNPMLGQSLVDGINSVLDSNGFLIEDKIAELFAGSIPKIDLTTIRTAIDLPREQGAGLMPADQPSKQGIEILRYNIPGIVSSLDKLREAQALTVKSFMDGTIPYKEYSSQMETIRDQNVAVSETFFELKKNYSDQVTDLIKQVAVAGGIEDEFVKAEDAAKQLMDFLEKDQDIDLFGLDNETSKFYTSIQIAAAYGDISEADVRYLLTAAQDPNKKIQLGAIFNVEGAQENATEIIKLISSGMSTSFIQTMTIRAEEIGTPLNELYATLVAISSLPSEIQQNVMFDLQGNPELLKDFISNYEYVMSLPNDNKELKAEVFGNEYLETFQDNWQSLLAMAPEARKKAILEYYVTGTYNFEAQEIPAPTAVTELAAPDVSTMMGGMSTAAGGGGGGESDTSAIEEKYDKLIKAQDKVIQQIQKEREERQKLLDLEKQAFDFAMQEQDLKNQIARARAEGNTAEAAMLQAKLDNARAVEKEQEGERLRQEEEDRRIKNIEKEKKRLEKQKQKEIDAASGGSSSGGGGDSGLSEEKTRKIEQSLQFLNDELNAALLGNTEILDQINKGGAEAFWDSEPIKKYIKAATDLGIPLDSVKTQLEGIYDELVNKGFGEQGIRQFDAISAALVEVGISGETLTKVLPNVFGAFRNKKLTESQIIAKITEAFINAGDSAKTAGKRAKEFFAKVGAKQTFESIDEFDAKIKTLLRGSFSKRNAELASDKFAEGMRDGLTNKQILDSISDSIYDATFKNGIAKGMEETHARQEAKLAASAMKNTLTEEFDQFNVNINHVGKYDDSQMPNWLREENRSAGGLTADQQERIISHKMSGTVDMALVQGSKPEIPLWVKVVGGDIPTDDTPGGGNNGTTEVGTTRVIAGRTYYWNGSQWVLVDTRASGGWISKYAAGSYGSVRGPGGPKDDLIPAMLSNGEYVIQSSSVNKYGVPFFDALNSGTLSKMAAGGYSRYPSMVATMSGGGYAMKNYSEGGLASESGTEYNINVYVTEPNASADEIANKIMQATTRRDKMNRAGIRI